jgi:tetratricopeptide (TPR) repeat protein
MERSIYKFILILILTVSIPIGVAAQSESGGVENVFSYGAGLRALGMGGAFTAMTGDPTLAYWNPGAMAFNQYMEVSVFGTRLIADSYYFAGFYTHPTIKFGTVGLGGMGIYTGGIESYDENASPITDAGSTYLHYQLMLSYGYNFRWGLGVGGAIKVESLKITDFKGNGASFDVGVYYSPPKLPWLSFGAVVQDVYGTGLKLDDEFEQNTRIYKAGVATNFLLGEKQTTRLTLALDGRAYKDNYNPSPGDLLYDLSIGAEASFAETFMIRGGMRNIGSGGLSFPQGASIGASVRVWGIGVDYAVSFEDSDWQGAVELLMRLGLSYRFGKSVDERKTIEAERLREQIEEARRQEEEKYRTELDQLSQDFDQQNEELMQDILQYQEQMLTKDTTLEDTSRELSELRARIDESLRDLDEQRSTYELQRAALELQLLQQQSTYEQQLGDLGRQFDQERDLRQRQTADEARKSELYATGLQLFSEGEFERALESFNALSQIDPNYLNVQEYINKSRAEMTEVTTYSQDVLNLYYEGMELYLEKRYADAISKWEEILEIDPYNKLARRNIDEARKRLRKLEELGIGE